jgi:hypothetical protein
VYESVDKTLRGWNIFDDSGLDPGNESDSSDDDGSVISWVTPKDRFQVRIIELGLHFDGENTLFGAIKSFLVKPFTHAVDERCHKIKLNAVQLPRRFWRFRKLTTDMHRQNRSDVTQGTYSSYAEFPIFEQLYCHLNELATARLGVTNGRPNKNTYNYCNEVIKQHPKYSAMANTYVHCNDSVHEGADVIVYTTTYWMQQHFERSMLSSMALDSVGIAKNWKPGAATGLLTLGSTA